ncbi:MAG: hypothetical protein HZA24_11825 [Nitrospirae bacterium]|nr:hypothetical protein [Nitrospirota bacterium]
MRGLTALATDPARRHQNPDEVLHLWASGMEGNPGAYERAHPTPPWRTVGQVVGYETDFYADQRRYPFTDGLRADWHDVSGKVGGKIAKAAHAIGATQVEQRLLADAERDQRAAEALRTQHKYDPNAYLAFLAGRYGRQANSYGNIIRKVGPRVGRKIFGHL